MENMVEEATTELVVDVYNCKKEEPDNDPNWVLCKVCNVLVNLAFEDLHDHFAAETDQHTPATVDGNPPAIPVIDSKILDTVPLKLEIKNEKYDYTLPCKMEDDDGAVPDTPEQEVQENQSESLTDDGSPDSQDITIKMEKGKSSQTLENCNTWNVRGIENSHKNDVPTRKGKKSFICKVCNKTFVENSVLKVHMRLHTGEKPFKCDVCNKRFIQKSDLVVHMRTHSGEKPFICHICEKPFVSSCALRPHLLTHTGEKPFTCELCNKKFTRGRYLKVHLRIHTGEKPFICNVCSKPFTYSSGLKVHMRTHKNEKPSTCNLPSNMSI